MLSKFIYRFLAIAMFAVLANVGYSQNYVDVDVATERLEEAITELQDDLGEAPVQTGSLYAAGDTSADKIRLQLMKTVRDEIGMMKSVKEVMDSWYDKAGQEPADRKTKLTLALDRVKNLLS